MEPSATTSRAPTSVLKREAAGWAMFDFANSSYTTVIITVVYAVVFPRVIVGDAPSFRHGNLLWSLALAASYGLVVLLAPIVGTLVDLRRAKKRALLSTTLVTVAATAALGFVGPSDVALAIALVVISNTGFGLGESLVASFLPFLGPPEALGRISGYAWALGYVGGLASTAAVLLTVGPLVAENAERLRLVGPITAAFFALGSVPTFLLLREHGEAPREGEKGSLLASAFVRLVRTARDLPDFRELALFLGSVFFAMAGLGIVIAFAFVYGDQVVHWRPATQATMFLLTQVSATIGAVIFGRLQARLGDLVTYRITLFVWLLVVLLVGSTRSLAAAMHVEPEKLFLAVGTAAGLCLGATMSASRTIVALFSPEGREGELAGLWGLSGKLAQMMGLVAIGALQRAFGLERAILVCGVFFMFALAIAFRVDEAKGRAAARCAQPPA